MNCLLHICDHTILVHGKYENMYLNLKVIEVNMCTAVCHTCVLMHMHARTHAHTNITHMQKQSLQQTCET